MQFNGYSGGILDILMVLEGYFFCNLKCFYWGFGFFFFFFFFFVLQLNGILCSDLRILMNLEWYFGN